MTRKMTVAALALACAAGACGAKEDKREQQAREQAAEATRQAAEATQQAAQAAQSAEQAAQEAAKGFDQLARALGGAAADGDGKAVNPVSFRDMHALFPDLDGWEKGRATGERITVPFPVSQAEVTYTRGNSRITLKTMDSGFNQLFLAPYAMFLQTGYERQTEDGYERSISVGGQPGWEKWNPEAKDGELNALVGKRFLLTIDGSDIDDVKVLHALADRIDMTRFAALK